MSTPTRYMLNVEQAHLELIKSLLSEFARGNLDGVRALLTPDVKFHFPSDNSLSGEYKGVDASLGLLDRITQWTGGTTRAVARRPRQRAARHPSLYGHSPAR